MSTKKAPEKYEFKAARFTILAIIHVIAVGIFYALLVPLQEAARNSGINSPALVVPIMLAIGVTAEIISAAFVSKWMREYLLVDLVMFLIICALAAIFPSRSADLLLGLVFWLLLFAVLALFQTIIVSIVNAIKRSAKK